MEQERATRLTFGTWIGLVGLVAALFAIQRADMHYLMARQDAHTATYHKDMLTIHERICTIEVKIE
jgi:hypothetical protein